MQLTPEDLQRIAARTVAHYDKRAQAYWEGTRDHDVSQNITALLQSIETEAPFVLLDFGCGPGRDLKTFKALGHSATGLEGSPQLAAMARANSGCEVLEQSFLKLDLPSSHFDGVFANAVLFHVPSQELPHVLRELHTTLKPGGVLFSSNPRGHGQEGWSGDRYGAFHDWETWRDLVTAAGFVELTHYYRPTGVPLEQQPWLASVWRKPMAIGIASRPRLLPRRRFPPYAYLPGRYPHPVRDFGGHSYGQEPATVDAGASLDTEAFRWGADLFNHGYYWEAHEAWEPVWRAADRSEPLALLLKGLILLAATGVKIREGKKAAAVRHARRAAALFRQVAMAQGRLFDTALGMPLAALADYIEVAPLAAAPLDEAIPGQPEPVFSFVLASADHNV